MDERILFWGLGGLLGLAGLGLLGWALFYDRAKERKRCPKCWYDMTHAATDDPLRCPECGYRAKRERRLLKTRRKWRWACVALLLIGPSLYLLALPKARRDGWMTFVPNTVLISCITEKPESWAFKEIASRMKWHGRDVSRLLDTEEFEMWGWQWRWLASKSAEKSIAASVLSNSAEEVVWRDRIYDDVFSRIPSPYNRAALPSLRHSFQVNKGLIQGLRRNIWCTSVATSRIMI